MRIKLVPYVSVFPSNRYIGENDSSTFVLARYYKCRPEGSN